MGDVEEDGLNRLEGISDMPGGLIIRKKKSDADEKLFKNPGRSLLGLDMLAQSRARVEANLRKRRAVDESPGGLTESTRKHIAK